MKKLLAGAVAALAIAVPAASAETNAVVGVNYGNTDYGFGDYDSYGFNAAFSHDLNNGAVLQFDGAYNRLDGGACCSSAGYGAIHYAMRNDSHAFGGFVMLDDFFGYSAIGAGVEGSMYFSSFVLNGSLGYADFSDLDASLVAAQIDGAYYITPNFAITALASYVEGEDSFSTDWTTLGIGGEYRFSGPASITLGYRNTEFDGGDADTWTIGLNFDLGTGSLRDRATSGPSLSGAAALHNTLHVLTP